MIIALAGRRIDASDAVVPRLPYANVALVRRRLKDLFRERQAVALVSSAACGADLIAQGVAVSLGLACTIVLPLPPAQFKERSVVDRPGDWGSDFDRSLDHAHRHGTVIELGMSAEPEALSRAYERANETILDVATGGASGRADVLAVVVWEGESRGPVDLTAAFVASARARGLAVEEVSTV